MESGSSTGMAVLILTFFVSDPLDKLNFCVFQVTAQPEWISHVGVTGD